MMLLRSRLLLLDVVQVDERADGGALAGRAEVKEGASVDGRGRRPAAVVGPRCRRLGMKEGKLVGFPVVLGKGEGGRQAWGLLGRLPGERVEKEAGVGDREGRRLLGRAGS